MQQHTSKWLMVVGAQALLCSGAAAAAALLDWALEGQLIPRLLKCLHDSATLVHSHGPGEVLVLDAPGVSLQGHAATRPGVPGQSVCSHMMCVSWLCGSVGDAPCHASHGCRR